MGFIFISIDLERIIDGDVLVNRVLRTLPRNPNVRVSLAESELRGSFIDMVRGHICEDEIVVAIKLIRIISREDKALLEVFTKLALEGFTLGGVPQDIGDLLSFLLLLY